MSWDNVGPKPKKQKVVGSKKKREPHKSNHRPDWPVETVEDDMEAVTRAKTQFAHLLASLLANEGLEARTVLGDEDVDKLIMLLEGKDDGIMYAIAKIKGFKLRKEVEFPSDMPF